MSYPGPYIVEPQPGCAHTHTIILLHGRSSTAKEFATDLFALSSSVPRKSLPGHFPNIRWVFLDAGERWCTPFREKRSAWCDTFSLENLGERQDLQVAGLRDGIFLVRDVVEQEIERLGGESNKVILGGFSQGSATALWSLFTGAALTKGCLGGFIGLSAWMPFTREAKQAVGVGEQGVFLDTRYSQLMTAFLDTLGVERLIAAESVMKNLGKMHIYLGHGTDDIPVSVTNCHQLASIFQALEVKTEVREYLGAEREGHWVKEPEQLDDVAAFIRRQTVATE